MNYILKSIMIAVAVVTAIPSFAVSDKEMEAARTMAAKHYLRYANNGSDYLDKLSPSSMSELSGALKPKEKENLKAFTAVAVPKDYASWDKARLVEYWSSTFFKSPGLKEDGKKCLGILAKKLNKINVAAAAAPAAAETKAEQKPEGAPAAPAQEAGQAQPASADLSSGAAGAGEDVVDAEAAAAAELDALAAQAAADAGVADEQPKKSSNTGWYIAILVVLIGVVVWLVMYASKSMKDGTIGAGGKDAEKEIREARKAAKEEANKMREQYASSLAVRNDEIKQLKTRVEELEAELDNARDEIERMRKSVPQARVQPVAQQAPRVQQAAPQPKTEPRRQNAAGNDAKPKAAARPAKLPPVVYLGYVNQRGLFVKASRSLNQESSVYYMDIPDGEHGTFVVANDFDVFDRVLADPEYWLGGGCVIENPEDADIAAEIVTIEAGEALFADNTCRVVKKARIKFI